MDKADSLSRTAYALGDSLKKYPKSSDLIIFPRGYFAAPCLFPKRIEPLCHGFFFVHNYVEFYGIDTVCKHSRIKLYGIVHLKDRQLNRCRRESRGVSFREQVLYLFAAFDIPPRNIMFSERPVNFIVEQRGNVVYFLLRKPTSSARYNSRSTLPEPIKNHLRYFCNSDRRIRGTLR